MAKLATATFGQRKRSDSRTRERYRPMAKTAFALVFASLTFAGSPGISLRAGADSYPVHQDGDEFTIGAALIPPEQAKKMFKLDLGHAGYVVVEVGIFPKAGKTIDCNPADFTLFIAADKMASLRPVSADTVAEVIGGRPDTQHGSRSGPHDINTSVGASVGHVSYPDPTTGRRTSGTVTRTEVGVGVGGPPPRPCHGYDCDDTGPYPYPYPTPTPAPSPTQVNTISQDLWEKSLPDGPTPHAIAGYLYFPKPSRKGKNNVWELRLENAGTKVHLSLPK